MCARVPTRSSSLISPQLEVSWTREFCRFDTMPFALTLCVYGGRMPSRFLFCEMILALFLSNAPFLRAADNTSLYGRRAQLKQLLADEWEYELKESPERATVIGDYRYNDRWSDESLAHVQQQKRDFQDWLAKFEALDTTGFPEQEKLSQGLMVRNLKQRLEGIVLKNYEMPIDQFNGAHLQLAQFVAIIPFNTTKQYEDYLARLHKVPAVYDQVIELMQQGKKDQLM